MKKLLSISMAFLLLFTLTACSKDDKGEDESLAPVSSVYNEETVKEELTSVVYKLHDGDFEELFDNMTPEMQEALIDANGLGEVWRPISEQVGHIVEIEDIAMEESEGYMVSQALVKYENAKMVVQVTWDEDMKIAGLFFK